jgi:hypothetical protein
MANASYIQTLLAAMSREDRQALNGVFEYLLANLRLGHADTGTRAENFQLYALEGTTASVANTEFTIAHGLGTAPYLLIPVLPLDAVNAELVPLKVTRAADASRVYLSSSVASAPIRMLVEG